MKTKLSLFKIRQRAYHFVEVGAYPFIAFIFAALLCWQSYSVYSAHAQLRIEIDSRDALNAKLDKFRENAKISEQDRLVYGTIIKRQVPQNNNTFDTYALMESFYEQTGIELAPASSGVPGEPTKTKSAQADDSTALLKASAVLTAQGIEDIISRYQFQFARFMTLNEITVTTDQEGKGQVYDVDFAFKLYSMSEGGAPAPNVNVSAAQFTTKDKENFDSYINSANIDLYYATQNAAPVDEDYEPAGSIF
ncbi:hypothetical protein KBB12_02970 [Candidatus Woesebacteria bacterium]|nr:hypothetical protein [Candidatus Woesebacteria bacterium]